MVPFVCALVGKQDSRSGDFFHLFDFEGDDFSVHGSLLLVTGDCYSLRGDLVGHDNAGSRDFFHLFNFKGDDLGIHCSVSFLWLGVGFESCFQLELVGHDDSGSGDFFHLFNFEGDDFSVHCSVSFLWFCLWFLFVLSDAT
ncbi:MAG TPA: hypothetical protein VNQ79_15625 [Blastocatellia bacterium]|nr:hypothetical protein [Blastocatellia bacterium]